jgi:Holliday junction resolvase-like predicted endonuclease
VVSFGFLRPRRKARKGLVESPATDDSSEASVKKAQARRTGVRGETYAYWCLRRHGYVVVARNYMRSGVKGEIDIVGYDGPVLAFVEVKTRAASDRNQPSPEDAVNAEKRRNLARKRTDVGIPGIVRLRTPQPI